jgi:hypothetical protein
MMKAQSRDAGVMHRAAPDSRFAHKLAPESEIPFPLAKQHKAWGFQPALDLLQRIGDGRRRGIDAGVRDYGRKFVQAWPRNGPLRTPFSQPRYSLIRFHVPGRVRTMCIYQDVGVDSEHFYPTR